MSGRYSFAVRIVALGSCSYTTIAQRQADRQTDRQADKQTDTDRPGTQ